MYQHINSTEDTDWTSRHLVVDDERWYHDTRCVCFVFYTSFSY